MQIPRHVTDTPALTDFPRMLKNAIKPLLFATALGALIALAISLFLTPKWTAKVPVKVGQIAAPGQAPRLVETLLTTVDRLNQPSFRAQVIKSLGLPSPDSSNKEAKLIFDSMRATPSRAADVLNLQVSANSREQAAKALQASVAQLNSEHRDLFLPSVERMKAELANTTSKLAEMEREHEQAYRALKAGITRTSNTVAPRDILASNVLSSLQSQILELQKRKDEVEAGLEPGRTYPTRLMGEVYVPQHSSTPGRLLIGVAGAALGLFAGLAFAFFQQARSSLTSQESP